MVDDDVTDADKLADLALLHKKDDRISLSNAYHIIDEVEQRSTRGYGYYDNTKRCMCHICSVSGDYSDEDRGFVFKMISFCFFRLFFFLFRLFFPLFPFQTF